MKVYLSKEKCYGCGQCAYVCPVNAITMVYDEEGFLYPRVDEEKCINCNKCKKECVAEKEKQNRNYNIVHACVTKDSLMLYKSTSGGVFGELAKRIILDGGVVYGAAYVENRVRHIRITEEKDICLLQGSKYVQSELFSVLEKVKEDIACGKVVLFSGTPCQVASVRNIVGDNENLLCVDIACMGVPSPKVWESYINQYQSENGEISDVKFRHKDINGDSHNISYIGTKGTKTYNRNEDMFMKGFNQGLFLRPSCHMCKYKGENFHGDIRIGDFWGIEKFDDNISKNSGVSVVIIQSPLGEKLFKNIQDRLHVSKFLYKQALAYNEHFEVSKTPSPNRVAFFADYEGQENDIKALIAKYVDAYPTEEDIQVSRKQILENISKLASEKDALNSFFGNKGIHNIAIYGYGKFGCLIVELLVRSGVNVRYIVDKNFDKMPKEIDGVKVIGLHQVSEVEFDAMLVTVNYQYDLIKKVLKSYGVSNVMSVSEIK